jgi:hypothetical protein
MPDTTLALTLLALFTTADKAAEIEGDLLEQAQGRGRLWFWWQIKFTCIALFLHNLRAEPGKLLIYGYATYELGLKLAWWVLNPLSRSIRRGLHLEVSHSFVNYLVILNFAFVLGLLITRYVPRQGGQILLLAGGFLLGRELLLDGFPDAARMAAFALLPAVTGALVMKWQELRYGGWNCVRHPTDTA